MTLDEAIKHAEKIMVENLEKTKGRSASDPIAINCFECAEEHRQLAEWLKELKQLREQTKWIPVSKRLPDDYKIVIASVDHQFVYPEARYSKEDGWEWAYESGSDYWVEIRGDVDAWMPLPKPYEPQKSEE